MKIEGAVTSMIIPLILTQNYSVPMEGGLILLVKCIAPQPTKLSLGPRNRHIQHNHRDLVHVHVSWEGGGAPRNFPQGIMVDHGM